MKKILLLSIACLLSGTATTFAQKISVASGDVKILAGQKEVGVVFTYKDMLVGKGTEAEYVDRKVAEYNEKEPGRGDAWRDSWYADRENRFEPKFMELFDKYMAEDSKGGGFTMNPYGEQTKYIFNINTTFTEPGYNVGIVRGNSAVSLEIRVTERATGAEALRIVVVNASANSFTGTDFEAGFRIQESYAKAGRELARYLIKALKL